MVKSIRNADKSKGDGIKNILSEENELFYFAKRRIQAIKDIKKGDILKEGMNIEILRPGNKIRGLDPRLINQVDGKKAKTDIKLGDGITEYQ